MSTTRTITDIGSRPPFGLNVDWVEQDNGLMKRELVPADNFHAVVYVCNAVAMSDEEIGDGSGFAYQLGKKYELANDPYMYTEVVKRIWSRRELYREVAEKHFPNMGIYWD